ncbi:MAG: rhgT [Glaciihabitans sp.]|nr:rhgT [Glaciihabitans sp.]
MTRVNIGDDADTIPNLSMALADPEVTEIVLNPGVYVEHVVIAPRSHPLLLRSSTGDARDVTLTFGLSQGDRDRTGMEYVQACATLTIDADDVTLRDLTIENSFDKGLDPGRPNSQALAVRTRGDRITFESCRLLGQQDTVLLDAPSWASVRHVHLRDCEIVGDVDFVYGRATALIEGGTIRSVGPGYVAAPSTARENPRGFLFRGVKLVGDVAPGSVKLGRPWHPGNKPDAVGQAVFEECELGAHISAQPWDDMGGYSWADARLAECDNTGAGHDAPGRPRVPAAELTDWLAGWNGLTRPDGTLVVVSDSTACSYEPARAPRTGWGQSLALATERPVRNAAISGASSRSFIESGALDDVLEGLQSGDVLLIGFGHNDAKPDDRFADVFLQYPAQLRRYLVGARSRGATPVLLTPVERRLFTGGRAQSTHGGYPARVRALAAEEGVTLVDLNLSTRALWQELGEDDSRRAFLHLAPGEWPGYPDGLTDDTHLSEWGAGLVAGLVATGLRDAGILGVTATTRP